MFGKSSYLVTQKAQPAKAKDKKAKNGHETHESLILEDWQADKSLVEANRYMYVHQLACDIHFRVGEKGEKIGAHKYVLISRSSTFYILCQNLAPEDTQEMEIPDVEPDIFKTMLTYMYCDEVFLDDHKALPLLYCAKKYQIRNLVKQCVKHVEASLNASNACEILEQAYSFDERTLQDKALNYIFLHGDDVLKSEAVERLSRPCLMAVISSDALKASELAIFRAALNWATRYCEREGKTPNGDNKRDALGEALYLVRYLLLSQKDFVEQVSTQNVLNADEKCEVLESLAISATSSKRFSGKPRTSAPPTPPM